MRIRSSTVVILEMILRRRRRRRSSQRGTHRALAVVERSRDGLFEPVAAVTSQSSSTRRSPTIFPAICARRSPLRACGVREFARIRSIVSSRIWRPASGESAEDEAFGKKIARRPTSIRGPPRRRRCGALCSRRNRRASASKIGRTTVMSLRCVPVTYGSLTTHISPYARPVLRRVAARTRKPHGNEPRCIGMCSACAIKRPTRSKSAHEWSSRSLMFGE